MRKKREQEERELARRKDEFLGMAAHELKTPITTLNLYTQLLKERMLTSRDKENLSMLDDIEKQSARLVKLVNDLLTVNAIEAGKLILRESEFDICKLASKTASTMENMSGARISVQCKPQSKVHGDIDRIEEVLINLLSNAVKYSSQNPKIKIRMTERFGKALVAVEDKGPGIPKKDQKGIFSRYYRGSGACGRAAGFGLGLYISSEIIKRHRQKIWVESKLGQGSKFYFTLALVK